GLPRRHHPPSPAARDRRRPERAPAPPGAPPAPARSRGGRAARLRDGRADVAVARPRRRPGRPAARARRRDPRAGGREGPRPGAGRRCDLHRVAIPRPDVSGRRQGAHADHAGHRRLHRAQVRRQRLRAGRPGHAGDQHRLRMLVPALPARPLPREHGAGPGRLQRGRGQGRRVGPGRAESRRALPGGRSHPVPRDARLRPAGRGGAPRLSPRVLARAGPL
ncbi:MAG: GH23, partial [uncultured Solirubrobacteraceae bacterium]